MGKPAERLLLYTGDFGLEVVRGLTALVRNHGRRELDDDMGLAPYLVEGFAEWLRTYDPARLNDWTFVPGPKVEIDRFSSAGPFVRVPRGDVDWHCGHQFLGSSSRLQELSFPLDPAPGWEIRAENKRPIRLTSHDGSGTWVFDERGRLHRSGPLLGLVAYVVSTPDVTPEGASDLIRLDNCWSGHVLATVDLRGRSDLVFSGTRGRSLSPIAVDSSWSFELGGDVIGGVTTVSGQQVTGSSVQIRPGRGYFPPFEECDVTVLNDSKSATASLDSLPNDWGAIDLTALLDGFCGPCSVVVRNRAGDSRAIPFARLPDIDLALPLLAAPDQAVTVQVGGNGRVRLPDALFFAAGESVTRFEAEIATGSPLKLEGRVPRCRWDVRNPRTIVPDFNGETFVVRPDEMRHGVIELLLDDTSQLRLWLEDGSGHMLQRLRFRRRPGSRVTLVNLDAAIDTALACKQPMLDVVLHSRDGRSVTLGHVQTGPSWSNPRFDTHTTASSTYITATWTEHRPWPNRVLRLWNDASHALVHESLVAEDSTAVKLEVFDADGAYRIQLDRQHAGWGAGGSFPNLGPTCSMVFVGSGAAELSEAVRCLDRRAAFKCQDAFSSATLLADLWTRGLDGRALTHDQTELVAALAFEDADVLVDFLLRVHNSVDEAGIDAATRIWFVRQLFDAAISPGDDPRLTELLEQLWASDALLAAAFDADTSCARWSRAAGWSWHLGDPVGDGLTALADPLLAAPLVSDQDLRVHGAAYMPLALGSHHWFKVTRSLPETLSPTLQAWVSQWPEADHVHKGPVWSGFLNRLRPLSLDSRHWRVDALIRAFVGATCIMIDPVSTPDRCFGSSEALALALEECPDLANSCVLMGIAVMRTLTHAPGWNGGNR